MCIENAQETRPLEEPLTSSQRHHIKLKSYGNNHTRTVILPPELHSVLGYSKTILKTNQDGWLYSQHDSISSKPENDVYILGDSWAETSFLPDGDRLHDVMNFWFRNNGKEYVAYNCSMSGSSLLHLYNLFINRLIYKPLAGILICPGPITSACNFCQASFWTNNRYSPLTDIKPLPFQQNSTPDYQPMINILKLFINAACIFKKNIYFCLVPAHSSNKSLQKMCQKIKSFLTLKSIPYFDPLPVPNQNSFFYDNKHLNIKGSHFYGEKIARWLSPLLETTNKQ